MIKRGKQMSASYTWSAEKCEYHGCENLKWRGMYCEEHWEKRYPDEYEMIKEYERRALAKEIVHENAVEKYRQGAVSQQVEQPHFRCSERLEKNPSDSVSAAQPVAPRFCTRARICRPACAPRPKPRPRVCTAAAIGPSLLLFRAPSGGRKRSHRRSDAALQRRRSSTRP